MAVEWSDEILYRTAVVTMYVMCPLTVLSLRYLTVPYGRYARSGSGPALPPALAWFVMESPTLWLTVLLIPSPILDNLRLRPLSLVLLSPFLLHYAHRVLIYPLRLLRSSPKRGGRGFPLGIAACGVAFNLLNAYIQSRSLFAYAVPPSPATPLVALRVALGAAAFLYGMQINVAADIALLRIKAEAGGGYRIPRGGWFELVSCPNYMGEALEWLGWAVAAWSPAPAAFFLYTCANLLPRAAAHHRWYQEKFGADYPAGRKAVIPFIY